VDHSIPLNYFLYSYGVAAKPTMFLGQIFATIVSLVCIIIAGLLLTAILRKRPAEDTERIIRGQGLRWIIIGTSISTAILFFMMVYALVVLDKSAMPDKSSALSITVTGYDWWWKVEYENPKGNFETANEIHIPVGVPVLVKLKSADVIHAFWVPQLAGKTEMIPGIANQQWIQADTPGIYHGKCTQFCGLQHAHMDFEVIAENQDDFNIWQEKQLANATTFTNEMAQGQQIFMDKCSGCHAVRGTDAIGGHAPDLTHLQSRRLIAAGLMPNNQSNLMDWIKHAQELKPGSLMPNINLTPEQEDVLSAYLNSLK
jgi:cytochrome c oxidase subunit 2